MHEKGAGLLKYTTSATLTAFFACFIFMFIGSHTMAQDAPDDSSSQVAAAPDDGNPEASSPDQLDDANKNEDSDDSQSDSTNVGHHDEKTGETESGQSESQVVNHGESGEKQVKKTRGPPVSMNNLFVTLGLIVLVFLAVARWDYQNSKSLDEDIQIWHWLWPPFYCIYVAGCYYLGWNHPAVSASTIVLALLAFLQLKQLHKTVFKFGKPKEKVTAFRVFWVILKAFSESTELMAIFLLAPLLCAAGYYASQAGGHADLPHFHVPFSAVFTIVGIMTAAKNAMNEVLQQVSAIERRIGTFWTLVLLSVLAALTGEPANADIQVTYLKNRLPKDDKKKAIVGIGVAAAIGSGGGFTFFSPPAIIIIWASVMVPVFGWGLMTLVTAVGLIVLAHVLVCVLVFARHIEPLGDREEAKEVPGDYTKSNLSLLILGLVILGHILVALPNVMAVVPWLSFVVYGVDVILGIFCLGGALINQSEKKFDLHTFEHDLLPILIGGLLIAIDNIGVLANPGVVYGGSHIPLDWIPIAWLAIALSLMMFVIVGVVSALADNALATNVFITLPITIAIGLIAKGMGLDEASYIANAGALGVIVGALTWGWITIQGNLPNFPIAKLFSIESTYWFATAFRTYGWTLLVPAIVMCLVVQFILPDIVVPLNLDAFKGGAGGGH